jgi:hypothetical protein
LVAERGSVECDATESAYLRARLFWGEPASLRARLVGAGFYMELMPRGG